MSEFEMQGLVGDVNWWVVGALVLGVAAIVLSGGTAAAVLGAEVAGGMSNSAGAMAFICGAQS